MARHNEDWEPSAMEIYAEKWLKEHGFEFRLMKRYISKSIYEVSKNGLDCEYHIFSKVEDPAGYMDGFQKFWETYEKVYGT